MSAVDLTLISFLFAMAASAWGSSSFAFSLFFTVLFLFLLRRKKEKTILLMLFAVILLATFLYSRSNPHIEEGKWMRGKSSAMILWKGSVMIGGKEAGILKIQKGPFRGKTFLAKENPGKEPGTVEKVDLFFQPFDRPAFSSQWNEEKVRESQGISGKVKIQHQRLLKKPGLIRRMENRTAKKIKNHFALFPKPVGPFLQKVFLGSVEEDLSIKELMKDLGILHLFAASGLHVSMIYTILLTLLSAFSSNRKKADVLIFTGLFFYARLLHFPASICRASLFLFFREIALLTHKKICFSRIFLLSLTIFLLFHPEQIFSPGLLLSYACALGIHCGNRIQKRTPFHSKFFETVRLSLWISLFTLPITAAMNDHWNPIVFLANLFAIPFFTLIFVIGMGLYFLSLLPFSFSLFMKGIARLYQGFEYLLKGLFLIRPPSIPLFSLQRVQAQYFLLLGLILFFRMGFWEKLTNQWMSRPFLDRKIAKARLIFFFQGLFLFSFFYLSLSALLFRGPVFYALDVGQGDAFLLQYEGKNILFDTGGKFDFREKKDRDGENFVRLLSELGVDRLDAVFLSHKDYDHIGNLKSVTERMKVSRIFCSPDSRGGLDPDMDFLITEDPKKKEKMIIEPVKDHQRFWISKKEKGGKKSLTITVLYQGLFTAQDRNNESMVLLLDYGPRILLTGDFEQDEKWKEYWPTKISLFKLAHHGSKKGTSLAILNKTQAQRAIISSGRNNSYGHPAPETLKRLEEAGIPYDRTSEMGTVVYQKVWGKPNLLYGIRKRDRDQAQIQSLLFSALFFFYWMTKSPLSDSLIEIQGSSLAANRKDQANAKQIDDLKGASV